MRKLIPILMFLMASCGEDNQGSLDEDNGYSDSVVFKFNGTGSNLATKSFRTIDHTSRATYAGAYFAGVLEIADHDDIPNIGINELHLNSDGSAIIDKSNCLSFGTWNNFKFKNKDINAMFVEIVLDSNACGYIRVQECLIQGESPNFIVTCNRQSLF